MSNHGAMSNTVHTAAGVAMGSGPLRALFVLFETKAPGLPDALHTVGQLRRVAREAGLDADPGFDLDAYLADLRVRLYGPDGDGEEAAGTVGESAGESAGAVGESAGESAVACPAPVESDIPVVAALRDRLEEALLSADDAECAEGLNAASREFGLFPGVDGDGRPRVLAVGDDFASCLAAVLIPAAMSLAAPDRRRRIRSCGDPDCQALFLDRSRDGRGRYCSTTCSARARVRARRERAVSGGA